MFRLRILGSPDLTFSSLGATDGESAFSEILTQSKRFALLCYLVTEGRHSPVRRDVLLALFWPELDQQHAAAALRQSLYVLRQTLGGAIVSRRGGIAVDSALIWCDAVALQEALAEKRLEDALRLYRGALLEGFHASGVASEVEDWLVGRREHLKREAASAARDLSLKSLEGGNAKAAAQWARRGLEIEPSDEHTMRQLLIALDAAGDRAGAMMAYNSFARKLVQEVGVAPSAETQALLQAICDRQEASAVRPLVAGAPTDQLPDMRRVWRSGRLVGYAVVVGLVIGTLWVVLQDPGASSSAGRVPDIAVLPFQVYGPNTAPLNEGMMDMVKLNLEGLASFRTIDSRRTIALWEKRPEGSSDPIEVGRNLGAEYVILGSVLAGESQLRVSAEIFDIHQDRRLGAVRVEGHPDSLLPLVDRFSIEILRTLVPEWPDPGRRLSLARISTSSVPAMYAYLEGEQAFRQSRFDEAIAHYQRAVAADSLFSLALYRLADSYGYAQLEDLKAETFHRLGQQISLGASRLPPRELLLARAVLSQELGSPSMVGRLVEGTRMYPRDSDIWYHLGEAYYHLGRCVLAGPERASDAFRRSLALDPAFTPAYVHLINMAFNVRGDSAEAAELSGRYRELAPRSEFNAIHELGLALAFGEQGSRSRAYAVLDTLSHDPVLLLSTYYLNHPASWRERERVIRRIRDYPGMEAIAARLLVHNSFTRGRTQELLERLSDPVFEDGNSLMWLYLGRFAGMTVPDSALAALSVDPEAADGELHAFFSGSFAADQDRWEDHAQAVRALHTTAGRMREAGDSLTARFYSSAARGLEGYGEWRRTRDPQAISKLKTAQRGACASSATPLTLWNVNATMRLWLGDILRETGKPEEALRYYAPFGMDMETALLAPALLGRARALDALGKQDEAGRYYALFATAWQDADPELLPQVRSAREVLIARQ